MERRSDLTIASYVTSMPRTTAKADFVDRGTPEGSSSAFFAEVESIAAGWMLDFACRCLCRHFCEGNQIDFERSRDLALTVIKGLDKIETHQRETVCLCQLLTCIAEGCIFDSDFGDDQTLSPLENALSVWISFLKTQSEQDKLHKEIKNLIQIQAVAIYMEKGYFQEAAEVIERLFPESSSNEPLRMKLSAISKQKDPYHPFLRFFSFNLLIEKIKTYINIFLKKETNNFLLKEATKEVKTNSLENIMVPIQCNSTIETDNKNHLKNTPNTLLKLHKHSCSLPGRTFWKPRQIQISSMLQNIKQKPLKCEKNLQNTTNALQDEFLLPCRKKKPWKWEDDHKLKSGVRKFGVGNWMKILQNYDFAERGNLRVHKVDTIWNKAETESRCSISNNTKPPPRR
ncbi:PREDICTED: telomeric repeat-binding factor 1 isoform X1 [Thamnophis sirtalis]|uniref:Telomeric repeat-binding factor n=1 Tax=Thamnophis sirtalis TaxID=35019 RepID=A0A6I9X428_9SAUR|nr:PREDICTED: telomeric repeat-binding factor 1 isoform X1 [Thamnophis sirtalis]